MNRITANSFVTLIRKCNELGFNKCRVIKVIIMTFAFKTHAFLVIRFFHFLIIIMFVIFEIINDRALYKLFLNVKHVLNICALNL